MRKRFRGIQAFLAIVISFFILAFPAYHRCNKLSQTKFVHSDLSFQNPGQEEGPSSSNKEREFKGFGPTAFLTAFLLVAKPVDQSSHFFPVLLSHPEETPVLRC